MSEIHNPILRGFNPDPSIVRVGDDYYVATSTFEYHPAVRLHHSRDLVHWTVLGHALPDLDLRGVPDSGGVWAPSLSYSDGRFWLAYSVVRSVDGDDKDIQNYLVTATTLEGPWSQPVFLGSRGIDFSFFHDTDGTHWIVGVQWDHRPHHPSFSGLVLEQYLPDQRRTSGAAHTIFTADHLVEGPNLYRLGEGYLLMMAEGGTGWNHGISTAFSPNLLGPYEPDPRGSLLTTRDAPGHPLQKAGHGELVQRPDGQWFLAHLASRPTLNLGDRYCTLGRETCLQHIRFIDGWPRLADGGHHPAQTVQVPDGGAPSSPLEDAAHETGRVAAPTTGGIETAWAWHEDFSTSHLDDRRWSTLRTAADPQVVDLVSRPGRLQLRGGPSPASVFEQSMILTRVTEHHTTMRVSMDAEPSTVRESAGLIAWYDRDGWIWLQLTWDKQNGRHLRLVQRAVGSTERSGPIPAPEGPIELRCELKDDQIRFSFRAPEGAWTAVPGSHPAWKLSDDFGPRLRFTGMFLGLRAEDLDSRGWGARFEDVHVSMRR